MTRSPTRRGFTLPELLTLFPILVVFAAVATPLLRGTVTTLRGATAATAADARLDAAVAALRRDVWGAAAVVSASPHELVVTTADGHVLVWHLGPTGADRHADGDDRRWADVWPDATAIVDASAVRVMVAAAPGHRGGTVVLTRAAAELGGDK